LTPEAGNIDVLFFSQLKEILKRDRVSIPVPAEGISSDRLLSNLVGEYPELGPFRSMIRLAVNQRYSNQKTSIVAGDEVAVLTPVSGG